MITLEPGAVVKIQEILAEENNPAARLRVFVNCLQSTICYKCIQQLIATNKNI